MTGVCGPGGHDALLAAGTMVPAAHAACWLAQDREALEATPDHPNADGLRRSIERREARLS